MLSLTELLLIHGGLAACWLARLLAKKYDLQLRILRMLESSKEKGMPFVLPTFNILVNIWHAGTATFLAPDLANVPANLSPGRITSGAQPEGEGILTGEGPMWLRLPKGTDVRDNTSFAGKDTIECPAGSFRFYSVQWVDDIGGGFLNEHRFAIIQAIGPWPMPIPPVSGPFTGPPAKVEIAEASGSTAGVLSPNFTLAWAQSSGRALYLWVHLYGNGGPATLTLNGFAIALGGGYSVSYIDGATSGWLGLFNPGSGWSGAMSAVVAPSFAPNCNIQVVAFSVPVNFGLNDFTNFNFGNTNPPKTNIAAIAHAPEICVAAFGIGSETAAGAFSLPYTNLAAPIVDVVGAVTVRLATGSFDTSSNGNVQGVYLGETAGGWSYGHVGIYR